MILQWAKIKNWIKAQHPLLNLHQQLDKQICELSTLTSKINNIEIFVVNLDLELEGERLNRIAYVKNKLKPFEGISEEVISLRKIIKYQGELISGLKHHENCVDKVEEHASNARKAYVKYLKDFKNDVNTFDTIHKAIHRMASLETRITLIEGKLNANKNN